MAFTQEGNIILVTIDGVNRESVYIPKASYTQKGIASFDDYYFKVVDGHVILAVNPDDYYTKVEANALLDNKVSRKTTEGLHAYTHLDDDDRELEIADTAKQFTLALRDVFGSLYGNTVDVATSLVNWQTLLSKISEHNTDALNTAHPGLRQLIEALERDIARLDGRGKSYGMIDLPQSALIAIADDAARDIVINNAIKAAQDDETYEPLQGHLIYTKTVPGENEHEWEYNGTHWVDNGAWTIEKASNSEYGLIKGNDYLNIISGLAEVLLSNKTKKIINDADTAGLTYSEIYSKDEIDVLIGNLKAAYGWKDVYLGELIALSAIDVGLYDFVLIQAYSDDDTVSSIFVELKKLMDDLSIAVNTELSVKYDNVLKELQINGYDGYDKIDIYGIKMEEQKLFMNDEDSGKKYSYELKIKNGHPVMVFTEVI